MQASGYPVALLAAGLSFNALGQGNPEKPVRVVVPFPAGGAIGADNIARSPADGYNLLFASSSVLSARSSARKRPTTYCAALRRS